MNKSYDVVIVGTGHGGATAAAALRQSGFRGSIAMVTRESQLPYERPPLSKEYLSGERTFDQILLRPLDFWAHRNIDTICNHTVASISTSESRLRINDGPSVEYGSLIWAAGGSARNLTCNGADLQGIHTLRNISDVDRLRHEVHSAKSVVVVGGGFIGLEAAAVFRKFGKTVTVVESQDHVLARVAAEPISRFFEKEHRDHGVIVRLGVTVKLIEGHLSRVASVVLKDGSHIPADLIIVGVGIAPAADVLREAGAQVSNGVHVNEFCQTSLPRIFCIGDCALHPNIYANGQNVRVESVQNAHDQAQVVAKTICGTPTPYTAVPWFWSDQFDLKLQTVGLSNGFDAAVTRGDPLERRFSVIYFRNQEVIAADCVNSPRDYMHSRLLVSRKAVVDPERVTDPRVSLKELVEHSADRSL